MHKPFFKTGLGIFVLFLTLSQGFSQTDAFGRSYSSKTNPFRIFYFGYNMVHPGVSMGPELDFIWSRHEKISCDHGYKVIDKQLLFIPQWGGFTENHYAFDLFVNVEMDYRVTYHKGMLFEIFAAPGYAHCFGNGVTPLNDMELQEILKESHGGLLTEFGLGTGYDFHKTAGIPLQLNARLFSASVLNDADFLQPAFQAGITYHF